MEIKVPIFTKKWEVVMWDDSQGWCWLEVFKRSSNFTLDESPTTEEMPRPVVEYAYVMWFDIVRENVVYPTNIKLTSQDPYNHLLCLFVDANELMRKTAKHIIE